MKVTDKMKNMMNKEYKLTGESKLDVRQLCTRDKSLAATQCHHPQLFAGRNVNPMGLSESDALIGRNTPSNQNRSCRKNHPTRSDLFLTKQSACCLRNRHILSHFLSSNIWTTCERRSNVRDLNGLNMPQFRLGVSEEDLNAIAKKFFDNGWIEIEFIF
jgi:hypothetical protein